MARLTGKRARMYVAVSSGGTATPLAYQAQWTLSSATDTFEGTAFEDNNKTWFAGLPDASGTFSGFLDDATSQTYTASRDGQPRNMYLYPNTGDPSKYFFGSAIFDFAVTVPNNGMATVSGTWKAAGDIIRVP